MGLLNLATKIKNYKGIYIHYKFEGNRDTLSEVEKIRIDRSIIRHLTVKCKKLDTEKEYF